MKKLLMLESVNSANIICRRLFCLKTNTRIFSCLETGEKFCERPFSQNSHKHAVTRIVPKTITFIIQYPCRYYENCNWWEPQQNQMTKHKTCPVWSCSKNGRQEITNTNITSLEKTESMKTNKDMDEKRRDKILQNLKFLTELQLWLSNISDWVTFPTE